ncbi:hypothetical protein NQZ68_023052 [Dissostichus eleginoides]|nr:hypothetical protein NQZ68_023052 [Dissostichus eleginoides]
MLHSPSQKPRLSAQYSVKLGCKMAPALHCPDNCVLLSICQGDNFLPETLSLVITARDKLCRNSWTQPPTNSAKVKL